MKLKDIIQILNATTHYLKDDNNDIEITTSAASDLMSDILASVHVPDLLLSALNNAQLIRTCAVFGIKAVVIVRNRPVSEKLIEVAKEEDITLLSTENSLYIASGKLFSKGIKGVCA